MVLWLNNFFDSATFSPRNQASRFVLQPRPIKLTDSHLKKRPVMSSQ